LIPKNKYISVNMNLLITGISSGLGHSLAKQALAKDWRVYGLSRKSAEDLEKNENLKFRNIDIGDLENLEKELEILVSGLKELDLVILNAGILGEIQDLKDSVLPELKHIMDVNLWANKIIIDTLRTRIGNIKQIVAISSGASVSGQRGWSGYGISKAALNMMMSLYAAEEPGIHFSSLAPGLVQTAMQDIISAHAEPDRFPVVKRLQGAKNTPDMPGPDVVADRIWRAIPLLLQQPSGIFLDIRKMEGLVNG